MKRKALNTASVFFVLVIAITIGVYALQFHRRASEMRTSIPRTESSLKSAITNFTVDANSITQHSREMRGDSAILLYDRLTARRVVLELQLQDVTRQKKTADTMDGLCIVLTIYIALGILYIMRGLRRIHE